MVSRLAANASATPGSTPSASWEKSRATPMRRPFRSVRVGSSTPASIPTHVESMGSGP